VRVLLVVGWANRRWEMGEDNDDADVRFWRRRGRVIIRAVPHLKVDWDVWRDDDRFVRLGSFKARLRNARFGIVRCRNAWDEPGGHRACRLLQLEHTIRLGIEGRCPSSHESCLSGTGSCSHLRRTCIRDERGRWCYTAGRFIRLSNVGQRADGRFLA
jgi:hypothetical protein